jgi:hypothetical protein
MNLTILLKFVLNAIKSILNLISNQFPSPKVKQDKTIKRLLVSTKLARKTKNLPALIKKQVYTCIQKSISLMRIQRIPP